MTTWWSFAALIIVEMVRRLYFNMDKLNPESTGMMLPPLQQERSSLHNVAIAGGLKCRQAGCVNISLRYLAQRVKKLEQTLQLGKEEVSCVRGTMIAYKLSTKNLEEKQTEDEIASKTASRKVRSMKSELTSVKKITEY